MNHYSLYKANSITLKNKSHPNEKENVKRREKRNEIFSNNRKDLLTSTPLPAKIRKDEEAENIDPKTSKKEEYLRRFIEFKKTKQREREEKKKEIKPPFIPYGRPKKIEETTQSFAPQNHVFQFKKRESVYVAVPTPPKPTKKTSMSKKPTPAKFKGVSTQMPIKITHTHAQNLTEENKSENKKVSTPASSNTVATSTKRNVPRVKEQHQLKKPKVVASSTGAVAKAKALINKNIPAAKQPERAKLGISLKAKNKIVASNISKKTIQMKAQDIDEVITPLELCKSNKNFEYITSTKMKSIENKTDFLKFCKTISPITNEKSTSKRIAAKENQNHANGQRKFNFVVRQELEITTDITDVTIVPENDDKTLKNQTHEQQSANNIESSETEKTLVPNSNQILNKKNMPASIDFSQKPLLVNNGIQQQGERNKKFNFLKTINLNETSNESPSTSLPLITIDSKSSNIVKQKRLSRTRKTLDYTITAEENTKSDETLKNNDKPSATPERLCNYLSPFVTCSRGKVSAQKEREKRNSIYLAGTPTKIQKNEDLTKIETPIEKRRAREAVIYYRKQLNNEIERLHDLCDNWQIYKNENIKLLQQSGGDDMIDVTIGQAKLLTSKKFMQFKGLIDRCEANANGTAPEDDGSEKTKIITPIDLEGFWAMLNLQVDNIDKRFENLNNWKSNEWQDPEATAKPQPKVKTLKRTNKIKANVAAKVKPNVGLIQKMREMRAAMRTKKTEETNEINNEKQQQQQQIVEDIITYCSPRRLRRSTLTKINETSTNLNASKCLIPIVLPNRRSSSIARTVILVPSPITRLSKSPNSPLTITRNRRSKSGKFLKPNIQQESSAIIDRTPSPVNRAEYKPILKTPGTARSQRRNVSFNALCSVQKFRKLGKNQEATEYDEVQQVHIDELKSKLFSNGAISSPVSSSDDTDAEETRTYRLRNRKVKLRPSNEIEIPRKE